MEHRESFQGLVVATPERVAFEYEISGIGSRFLAQVLDALILFGVTIALGIMAFGIAQATGDGRLAILVYLVLGFAALVLYFPLFEWLWAGQTPGKRALRLRVVGDRGEPVTFTHVAVRNLVRIVDFLPVYYGVGVVALFANGRGKRLGDLAAGTVVVRDRGRVGLKQLVATTPALATPSAPVGAQARRSIWADEQEPPGEGSLAPPAPGRAAPAVAASAGPYGAALRRLDPRLRQFVVMYAGRRSSLVPSHRQLLADQVEPALRAALPEQLAAEGSLALLDHLADLI